MERIRHHFEVERELAQRLRNSTRDERTKLFKTLYAELFQRVPDHPRLTRRESAASSARNVEAQLKLLRPLLAPDITLLEFAPGDCRLAYAAAKLVKRVIGVDISDQHATDDTCPANFSLEVYDGYRLAVPDASVDLVFSYQLLEHLHPDDVALHFESAWRILKPGGAYVFASPHRYSGPHDVSGHFSNYCECFHFQEWTYRQMFQLLKSHGFAPVYIFRFGKVQKSLWFRWLTLGLESMMGLFPRAAQRRLSTRLFQSVTMVASKNNHR